MHTPAPTFDAISPCQDPGLALQPSRETVRAIREHIHSEVRALLTRLEQLRPFSTTMTMVPAANVSPHALHKIEEQQIAAQNDLRIAARRLLDWLVSPAGQGADGVALQNRFVVLKMGFNAVLSRFDIFADVLVQRSESGTGLWIAGLDVLATDAIELRGVTRSAPPLVCYLDRGHGAAIRRAKTALPGGGLSPVAIVRVPRERMVGLGIGASIVHEVGHQAIALLDLLPGMQHALRRERDRSSLAHDTAWTCWDRWISEVLADVWAVGCLGLTATHGLFGVIGLPQLFMFATTPRDVHPFPWIRALASIAFGESLYPDRQWERVRRMWLAMYPIHHAPLGARQLVRALLETLDRLIPIVLDSRPDSFAGFSLREAFRNQNRSPDSLRQVWEQHSRAPRELKTIRPAMALAAIGQARLEGRTDPKNESKLVSHLLLDWAAMRNIRP